MAISLDPVVTDYLTSVTTALTTGPDLGSGVRGAAQNYLRAQDMSAVLELLQAPLGSIGHATSANGTTTTLVDTAIFTANESVGNVVVFADDTTTVALRGVESRIVANSTTVLTVEPLPAATVTGDTYSIRGGVADTAIAALRQGVGLGDSPPGSVYGDFRQAFAGMTEIFRAVGGTPPAARVSDQIQVHPGGQPGDNAVLAMWISALTVAVQDHTIPIPGA